MITIHGLGYAYHQTQQYNKEKELYKKAEQDFPDNLLITQRQTILLYTEKDTVAANKYIEKYISILKEKSSSEADIEYHLAKIYNEEGRLDKAEQCYRQAWSLEPKDPWLLYNLAYFLIDNNRNIPEGLSSLNKELKLYPENHNFLHTKGWGLYKQGKNIEALDLLQKSWILRMKNAIYDHSAFLHLEEVKKAVANQK